MVELREISRADVLEGMRGEGAYCLHKLPEANWSNDPDERDLQQRRQALYLALIEQAGTCGLLAIENSEVAGFITFFHKTAGRRMGFYTLPGSENLARTLVVGCLHVAPSRRNRGIGAALVRGVKGWAGKNGYIAVEAIGEGHPQYGWHASAPFLASDFRVVREQCHGSWCGQMMRYTSGG